MYIWEGNEEDGDIWYLSECWRKCWRDYSLYKYPMCNLSLFIQLNRSEEKSSTVFLLLFLIFRFSSLHFIFLWSDFISVLVSFTINSIPKWSVYDSKLVLITVIIYIRKIKICFLRIYLNLRWYCFWFFKDFTFYIIF